MSDLPTPLRWMLRGAIGLGVVGAIIGLIVGLDAYPPTAGFAVLEVGIPCAVLGGLLGLAAGTIGQFVRRPRSPRHT